MPADYIEKAVNLRAKGEFDSAIKLLKDAKEHQPKDPDIEYQIGWTFDASDRSNLAIPHYEKALELALEDDRVGCFVALGSSYRAIGEYKKSADVLERGIGEFPEHRPLKVFLAMTQYNLGEYRTSVQGLLKEVAETTADSDVSAYKNAFLSYAEDLDAKW